MTYVKHQYSLLGVASDLFCIYTGSLGAAVEPETVLWLQRRVDEWTPSRISAFAPVENSIRAFAVAVLALVKGAP